MFVSCCYVVYNWFNIHMEIVIFKVGMSSMCKHCERTMQWPACEALPKELGPPQCKYQGSVKHNEPAASTVFFVIYITRML